MLSCCFFFGVKDVRPTQDHFFGMAEADALYAASEVMWLTKRIAVSTSQDGYTSGFRTHGYFLCQQTGQSTLTIASTAVKTSSVAWSFLSPLMFQSCPSLAPHWSVALGTSDNLGVMPRAGKPPTSTGPNFFFLGASSARTAPKCVAVRDSRCRSPNTA